MDAGALDVLHYAADEDIVTVGDRVDVLLDRTIEEVVGEETASLSEALDAGERDRTAGVEDRDRRAERLGGRDRSEQLGELGRDRRVLGLGLLGLGGLGAGLGYVIGEVELAGGFVGVSLLFALVAWYLS